jgi:hypothetical protein
MALHLAVKGLAAVSLAVAQHHLAVLQTTPLRGLQYFLRLPPRHIAGRVFPISHCDIALVCRQREGQYDSVSLHATHNLHHAARRKQPTSS